MKTKEELMGWNDKMKCPKSHNGDVCAFIFGISLALFIFPLLLLVLLPTIIMCKVVGDPSKIKLINGVCELKIKDSCLNVDTEGCHPFSKGREKYLECHHYRTDQIAERVVGI